MSIVYQTTVGGVIGVRDDVNKNDDIDVAFQFHTSHVAGDNGVVQMPTNFQVLLLP